MRQRMHVACMTAPGSLDTLLMVAVLHLCAEQALMLVKEPSNEYDPNAIRVMTLSGAVLGYVPAKLTARFPYDVCFGHVHHLGQVPDNGNWGALVRSSATASTSAFCCVTVITAPLLQARRDPSGQFLAGRQLFVIFLVWCCPAAAKDAGDRGKQARVCASRHSEVAHV